MNKKILLPYWFFILVYGNQGLSGLPDQCVYYLLREEWHLSAGIIGLSFFITAFAWYVKPIWGMLLDRFPICKQRTKNYLKLSYIFLILLYLYVICFGFSNVIILTIIGLFINCCIGINDVANDTVMVQLEKKFKLQGKIQALQWASLGFFGLFVSLVGAKIADYYPNTINYRVAYIIALFLPILTLVYLFRYYKEKPIKTNKKVESIKSVFQRLNNKNIILSLIFIACFQFCPSFGTALMIKARESLGVSKMFLGYLSATGTVLGLLGYVLYYLKFHKYSIKSLLYFTVIFSAVTNLFYLYIPNQWYLVLYNVLFGVFSGITFLTILSFFAKLVPTGSEGMIYAFITSLSNLCGRGGSWLGGTIYDHFGYETNVILSTVLTLLCLFFLPKIKFSK